MCTATRKNLNCGLASRYTGTITLTTHKNTLTEGLRLLLNSFNDSIGTDTINYLWNIYSTSQSDSMQEKSASDVNNISVITDILKNRGYCVAVLEPATYESIDALSKLPVLIWAVIIHYPGNNTSLISDTNLTIHSNTLKQYSENIQIHLIDNITKINNTYNITTRNRLSIQGLETDKLTSQILSIEEKSTSHYLQIVDCIIVSSLPLLELREHLNEWYSSIPYRNIMPQIKEIQ
jgi:hypothetical protein